MLTDTPPPTSRTRPVRVARLIALAHQLQRLVDAGESQADLARRLKFTAARISQLLDLMLLAPDIQERLLFMTTEAGFDPVTEGDLRSVCRMLLWSDQRLAFAALIAHNIPRVFGW